MNECDAYKIKNFVKKTVKPERGEAGSCGEKKGS